VSLATLQAAEGAPIPTKQTSLLESARAAAIVIVSVLVAGPAVHALMAAL
jgi:hypothetical protein